MSERTGVRLKSCRRQFDNAKRIYKVVEEQPGTIVNNIKHQFLLPEDVATKYSTIVFITRLRLETANRKLQYLNELLVQSSMNFWTYSYQHSSHPEYFNTEMDTEILLDLRKLKCILDKEKEVKHLVLIRLNPTLILIICDFL